MKDMLNRLVVARLFGLAIICGMAAAHAGAVIHVKTPLEVPARMSTRVTQSRLTDVVRTPSSAIVAVGQRGHIVLSRDGGKTWVQSAVPVSSDLVAAHFSSAQVGWVVGHDGVVLKTTDGGESWSVKLTGRTYGDIFVSYYEDALRRGEADAQSMLDQARRLKEDGADKPFLDVWFDDARSGWVIGAFNLILKTEDGGETWQPWIDRIDNDLGYTLFDMQRIGGELYITGELGLLLRLDRDKGRFVKIETPYRGTLFGLTGDDGLLVVYGLRGNAFASRDKGKTWSRLDTTLVGGISKAVFAADRSLMLVSGDGEARVSNNRGESFTKVSYPNPMSLSSFVDLGDRRWLVVGSAGVREIVGPRN